MNQLQKVRCQSCKTMKKKEKSSFVSIPKLCFGHYLMIAGIIYILILQLFFV